MTNTEQALAVVLLVIVTFFFGIVVGATASEAINEKSCTLARGIIINDTYFSCIKQ